MSELTLADVMEQGFIEVGKTQAFGNLFLWDTGSNRPVSCCAMGAALLGLELDKEPDLFQKGSTGWRTVIDKHYNVKQRIENPTSKATHPQTFELLAVITNLNDVHRWPIYKIVNWLRAEAKAGNIDIRHWEDIRNV